MATPVNIPPDERQDFFTGLIALGHGNSSFMIWAVEDVPLNPGPIQRTVSVKRTVGAAATVVHYEGGNGTDWVNEALDHVKHGNFGAP